MSKKTGVVVIFDILPTAFRTLQYTNNECIIICFPGQHLWVKFGVYSWKNITKKKPFNGYILTYSEIVTHPLIKKYFFIKKHKREHYYYEIGRFGKCAFFVHRCNRIFVYLNIAL